MKLAEGSLPITNFPGAICSTVLQPNNHGNIIVGSILLVKDVSYLRVLVVLTSFIQPLNNQVINDLQ